VPGVPLSLHGGWLEDADITVALKVSDVEGENTVDRVNAHHGDKAGVVDLDTLHAIVSDELLPSRVDRRDVRQ
jgi:hypothetical protein